ncbi:DUF4301 family protein [Dokdonia sp. R86516]|uniref:DUF4301 family protein n=1 Tax=Dokdonia sp. R86516 TaxID=3093856 RepID=UPI0037C5FC00
MKITEQDIEHITNLGVTRDQVEQQFQILKQGIPFTKLRSAATKGNGLIVLKPEEQEQLVQHYEDRKDGINPLKFTPASGAATRMFKFLFEFVEDYNPNDGSINAYINKKGVPELRLFFVGLESFPFYKKIRARIKEKYGKDGADINENRLRFVKIMLEEKELNFGKKPKGLFPFHSYKKYVAAAFEEHLFEGALYATKGTVARLHFTVSKEHQKRFVKRFHKRKDYIERKTGVNFDISYSYQDSATDTVAITESNTLLRDENGKLVFRPGGHGALIKNLNEQDADIIFIKNIDNVVVNKYKTQVAHYKKMLAGKLLSLQATSFEYLKKIDKQRDLLDNEHREIAAFLKNDLCLRLPANHESLDQSTQIAHYRNLLDRPIRVCGMVKNEGEPGGGPFWVLDEDGTESLQIIESVQINPDDKEQQEILKNATHFNPVDIICGVKNYKGEKYNLLNYVDYKAGFIASKSYQGKKIKALEHPGLWNGAMAHWNTIFIEVPLLTFNPVKTVNDLLKPAHQVK